ncbi:MAG: ABC transporter substrate-binding protein [Desulfurococcales archaeon]|nr:ABC transporter substrate-binding protein [Desulfurococcales archaeon]
MDKKLLIASILLVMLMLPFSYNLVPARAQGGLTGTIQFGALLPLTGDLASYGASSKASVLLAKDDVNKWLKDNGYNFQIDIIIEDTGTQPTQAVAKLNALIGLGVKVVIGPQTSAEVAQVKQIADQNHVLIISQSSTAPSLAIPNDMVYRFCPTDVIQGPVIAKAMNALGIKAVVPIVRNDDWGIGLYTEAIKTFQQIVPDGKVATPVKYDPKAPNFANVVDQANTEVQQLLNSGYKASQIGVLSISFNEWVQIGDIASSYKALGEVKWFGSDGTALLSEITSDPTAAAFAEKTFFLNPIFSAPNNEKQTRVANYIIKTTGNAPDTYALAAYDIVWAATLALIKAGKYDADLIAKYLPQVVSDPNNYKNTGLGATGFIELNQNGDRASADYALWVVKKNGTQYQWEQAGMYLHKEDKIVWKLQPPVETQTTSTTTSTTSTTQTSSSSSTTTNKGTSSALLWTAVIIIIIIIIGAAWWAMKK